MKKYTEILLIFFLILLIILIASNLNITGKIINKNHYTYTKAICNQSNYCEDYVIECDGKKTPKLTATGLSIQHDIRWIDERIKEENYCD